MNVKKSVEKLIWYRIADLIISSVVGFVLIGSWFISIEYTVITMLIMSIIYLLLDYLAEKYVVD